jgi:hypothetical protein
MRRQKKQEKKVSLERKCQCKIDAYSYRDLRYVLFNSKAWPACLDMLSVIG